LDFLSYYLGHAADNDIEFQGYSLAAIVTGANWAAELQRRPSMIWYLPNKHPHCRLDQNQGNLSS